MTHYPYFWIRGSRYPYFSTDTEVSKIKIYDDDFDQWFLQLLMLVCFGSRYRNQTGVSIQGSKSCQKQTINTGFWRSEYGGLKNLCRKSLSSLEAVKSQFTVFGNISIFWGSCIWTIWISRPRMNTLWLCSLIGTADFLQKVLCGHKTIFYSTSKILILKFGGPGIRTLVWIPRSFIPNRGSRYPYFSTDTEVFKTKQRVPVSVL